MSKQTTLDKLNGFIDKNSPKLAYFLQHTWKNQQQAVTYKELRTAIQNGEFDLSYLHQWQQDYSDFIAQYYNTPVVNEQIQYINALSQKFGGGYVEDITLDKMYDFLEQHTSELCVELATSQHKAIQLLVRRAALTDTMTVDQCARAIRPCIGLTTRQALSVQRLHDDLIDQGYSAKVAERKEIRYAEMVHRRRAATIAQTELAFAYNAGHQAAIESYIAQGQILPGVTKIWYTAADERVCDKCGAIDMEKVPLDAPFSNGVKLPPAHPLCRCTIAYDDLKSPAPPPAPAAPQPASTQQPTPTQAQSTAQPAPQSTPTTTPPPTATPATAPISPTTAASTATAASTTPDPLDPNYVPPSIPSSLQLSATDFTYKSHNNMGTGDMYQFTENATGDEWIFKPATAKHSTNPELFRGYVQEAGYKVQAIVDPDSALPIGTVTLDTPDGQFFGSIQQRLTGLDPDFDPKGWQNGWGNAQTPTPEIFAQLQRENVTDWLMCNYDSHGGNFLLTKDGKVIGVDKEQAFRYITQPGAQKMSYSYHPNSYIGETEPIYNTMYRKFAHGEIDLNLNDTLAYIKRVEAIPDTEYREIFRDYAEALKGKGQGAEQLLDSIVQRKQNLRSTFETFYGDLMSERTGGKVKTFQFVDTAAAQAASMKTATFSASSLKGMKLAELSKIAKQQGLKYATSMTKQELIDALSDPTKAQASIAAAKARSQQPPKTHRAPKLQTAQAAPTTPGVHPDIEGIPQLAGAMDDFDKVLAGSNYRGACLVSDSTNVEGMQTVLRKIEIDGQTYYELSGKLTYDRWLKACSNMKGTSGAGMQDWSFNVLQGKIDNKLSALRYSAADTSDWQDIPTHFIMDGDNVFCIVGEDASQKARAMMGQFRLRIAAQDGVEAARQARDMLAKAQMLDIIDDVTPQSVDRFKKMRALWQADPKAVQGINPTKITDWELDDKLSKLGISQQRVKNMKLSKVSDDFFTLLDPDNVSIAQQHGAAYLYHEAASMDAAVNVIKSGELICTTNRFGKGLLSATGASSSTDVRTGGADSVFTRIVYQKNIGQEDRYGTFGDYVFVFDTKLLERTDWYAYPFDSYGSTKDSNFYSRPDMNGFYSYTTRTYMPSNEVLFRKSVPFDTLKEIRVPQQRRQGLIKRLQQQGITSINGRPIDQVIVAGGDKV